jgi:hypothetical protein
MNILPALVSPPFPTPSAGVGLGIRTAGSRDEPIVLPTRSGPTEVRRGETVGPLTLLYAPAPPGLRKSTKRAGPFQEGGNGNSPALTSSLYTL